MRKKGGGMRKKGGGMGKKRRKKKNYGGKYRKNIEKL